MKPVQSNQPDGNLPADLSAPAQRALLEAGYTHLEQLTKVTEAEIKKLHGIGPNAIKKLHRDLEAKGLSFASEKNNKAKS